MKKLITLLALGIASMGAARAQQYDSLKNFLGESPARYKGQVIYVKHSEDARANNGYRNFALKANFDLGANGRNVFRSVPSKMPMLYVSNYVRMAGKYFKVTDVVVNTEKDAARGGLTHFLELIDLQTNETCYMCYNAQNSDCMKDVIVAGHYEKMRSLCIGRTYIYTGKEGSSARPKGYGGLLDANGSGQRKDIKENTEWKCVDVAIEDGDQYQFIAILENPSLGRVYTLAKDLTNTADRNAKFKTWADIEGAEQKAREEAEAMRTANAARLQEAIAKFGEKTGTMLAKGELQEGMTREQCRWAFGAPFNIYSLSEGGDRIEHWDYTNGLNLYFRNDKLIRHTMGGSYKDDRKYQHNSADNIK